jgi:DNA-directed RNA polymerase specialized sigma24 family protein
VIGWSERFDRDCERLVARIVANDATHQARGEAWRELLVAVAPHVEGWATRHPTLRRWGVGGPDDAREVLVGVIARLAADGWSNLHQFAARRGRVADDDPVVRLARLDELDDDDASETGDTPVRAWLRTLLRFAVHDHLRRRLGWAHDADRRAVGSGAERLSQVSEPGVQPSMTDWLTVRERIAGVDRAIALLPPPQGEAVRLWSEDLGFGEIADRLGLADAAEARRVVRAGHARLRTELRAVSEVGVGAGR